jgi:hypothetical protein
MSIDVLSEQLVESARRKTRPSVERKRRGDGSTTCSFYRENSPSAEKRSTRRSRRGMPALRSDLARDPAR